MNFVRGGDLFMHLSTLGGFLEEEARFIAAQLALALGYLHGINVIYRDLKLENILMNETGYISLVDFGISKQLDIGSRERTHSVRGTPEYMAPDIFTGKVSKKGYSHQIDWWALGIITYEMIVGQVPFFDEDENKMYAKIVKSPLEFPKELQMSKECKDFIEKLLHKDPTKRLGQGPTGYKDVLAHPFLKSIDVP
jgi:serine/threonine protein kinase